MDNSWQGTSNNSGGFIYFNTNNTNQEYHNKSDTTDFLAFSESSQASPQINRFKPSHYSSPQPKFHRGSPRNYPQNNRKYQRWSGGNRSFNNSCHSGSSQNHSGSSQNSSFRDQSEASYIQKFLHPSFLEDPWAKLEAKLKEEKQAQEEEAKESEDSLVT